MPEWPNGTGLGPVGLVPTGVRILLPTYVLSCDRRGTSFIKEDYSTVIKMAEEDIYGNKVKYERFKENLNRLLLQPEQRKSFAEKRCKYHCKNTTNLAYIRKLFPILEARDTSYSRRNRLLGTFRLIIYSTQKDLKQIDKEANREEINSIVAFMHTRYSSPKSKADFIRDLKYLWKNLFPELDEKGRVDDTLTPYCVRHLRSKMDKSLEKRRKDKLTSEEFSKIVQFFSYDPMMQFYVTFAHESLVRPQEACYIRLGDVEMYDNYSKIYLHEHGKEGVQGFLRCIDSYPYLAKWLEKHPFKNDPEAFLFIINERYKKGEQQKPFNLNKRLRLACAKLKINKRITCYSLKRNGVTFKRLSGYSDVEIQHIARWTSTKQLKTYDLSEADDTFKNALIQRGIIKSDNNNNKLVSEVKTCLFCDKLNSFTNTMCEVCKRPLDRKKIFEQEQHKDKEIDELRSQIQKLGEVVRQLAHQEVKSKEKC
tara:strand:- start:1911 stop:3353 length:1443 start_codon:yes stop_codon:yes gene_type:complete